MIPIIIALVILTIVTIFFWRRIVALEKILVAKYGPTVVSDINTLRARIAALEQKL